MGQSGLTSCHCLSPPDLRAPSTRARTPPLPSPSPSLSHAIAAVLGWPRTSQAIGSLEPYHEFSHLIKKHFHLVLHLLLIFLQLCIYPFTLQKKYEKGITIPLFGVLIPLNFEGNGKRRDAYGPPTIDTPIASHRLTVIAFHRFPCTRPTH